MCRQFVGMCWRRLEESVWNTVLESAETVLRITPSLSKSQSCRVVKTERAARRPDYPFTIDIIQSCSLALAPGWGCSCCVGGWVSGWWWWWWWRRRRRWRRRLTSYSLINNHGVAGEPVHVCTSAATHKQATSQCRRVGVLMYTLSWFSTLTLPRRLNFFDFRKKRGCHWNKTILNKRLVLVFYFRAFHELGL
jgi:hypothetical protein